VGEKGLGLRGSENVCSPVREEMLTWTLDLGI